MKHDKLTALKAQITHTNAMIALCKASALPQAEASYRHQLARLTHELHDLTENTISEQ